MYEKLIPELRDDPSGVGYRTMSDEEIAKAMLEPAGVEVVSYFAGLRALAAVLTPEEYNQVRVLLDTLAAHSRLVADMVRMLELPGDERGVGGGIDFGHPAVRQFIHALPEQGALTAQTKAKILALAERPVPRWKQLGLEVPPQAGNIASARKMLEE